MKKILIVEDDADILKNLKEILEDENYVVSSAVNGHDALKKLAKEDDLPHLIILDLMMPVMDGFEFRQKQELDPKIAHIPVIVMTADGHIETKTIKIGARAFIKKPPEISAIMELIAKHIL